MADSGCMASLKDDEVLCEDTLMLETDDEYIEFLLSKENRCCTRARAASSDDSLKSARSDAVRWILKMKVLFGLGMRTAYVAASYLDHFCVHRSIDSMRDKSWAIRLLSLSCLSLAVKMEELKVPALSEFRTEDYRFQTEAIQRMELLILSTLEWKMSMITPFSYLSYFASRFQEHGSEDLAWEAITLILASIEAINLVEYRPSVVAAAAILAASHERLTQKSVELKLSAISSFRPLDTDRVFSCYSLMIQETDREASHIKTFSFKSIGSKSLDCQQLC
ncbi:cyclin-D5-1-like [Musa acuminata AAA Group]|uniref:cyclin-D5-1-like n=1 Tax=Musa acuminata AAA Group TaxID=214697 RepID=UPI0031DEFA8B